MYGLTLPSHDDWYANSFLQEPHPRRASKQVPTTYRDAYIQAFEKEDILFLINGQSIRALHFSGALGMREVS
jgi:hypothetical protein